MGERFFKFGWLAKGTLAIGVLALMAMSGPANAASLRRAGTTGANANGSNGGPTGNYLFTWYGGNNDNVLRLIDPNGCGNGFGISNGACASEIDQCALIYVFDEDQEMGECCGCPITPNELLEFSVLDNLASNFQAQTSTSGTGVIVVVGSAYNAPAGCNPFNDTCNSFGSPGTGAPGCDPTVPPLTAGDTNLDGSITHSQVFSVGSGLTEIPLFDQGSGDPADDAYLVNECAGIAGNASQRAGYCFCPNLK